MQDSIPPREVQLVTNVNQGPSLRTPTQVPVWNVQQATSATQLPLPSVGLVGSLKLKVQNAGSVRVDTILTPKEPANVRFVKLEVNVRTEPKQFARQLLTPLRAVRTVTLARMEPILTPKEPANVRSANPAADVRAGQCRSVRLDSIPLREVQVVTNVKQGPSLRTPTQVPVWNVQQATSATQLHLPSVGLVGSPKLKVQNVGSVRTDTILTLKGPVNVRSVKLEANVRREPKQYVKLDCILLKPAPSVTIVPKEVSRTLQDQVLVSSVLSDHPARVQDLKPRSPVLQGSTPTARGCWSVPLVLRDPTITITVSFKH